MRSWTGIVAAILAVVVGVVLVAGETGRNLSQPEADLVGAILGTIVGALAGYIGGAHVRRNNGSGTDTGTGSGTSTSVRDAEDRDE